MSAYVQVWYRCDAEESPGLRCGAIAEAQVELQPQVGQTMISPRPLTVDPYARPDGWGRVPRHGVLLRVHRGERLPSGHVCERHVALDELGRPE